MAKVGLFLYTPAGAGGFFEEQLARPAGSANGPEADEMRPPTLPLRRRARPRARRLGKSKAVAGGQGRTVVDRSADPVREKCPHTLRRSDRRDSREHQGVGLDDAGAGGRGGLLLNKLKLELPAHHPKSPPA